MLTIAFKMFTLNCIHFNQREKIQTRCTIYRSTILHKYFRCMERLNFYLFGIFNKIQNKKDKRVRIKNLHYCIFQQPYYLFNYLILKLSIFKIIYIASLKINNATLLTSTKYLEVHLRSAESAIPIPNPK